MWCVGCLICALAAISLSTRERRFFVARLTRPNPRAQPTGLEHAHEQNSGERKGGMAAAAEGVLKFKTMTEVKLRQWVEANPGRVNDRNTFVAVDFSMCLYVCVYYYE